MRRQQPSTSSPPVRTRQRCGLWQWICVHTGDSERIVIISQVPFSTEVINSEQSSPDDVNLPVVDLHFGHRGLLHLLVTRWLQTWNHSKNNTDMEGHPCITLSHVIIVI